MTIECVESLLQLDPGDNQIHVVVVDNGSSNESGFRLQMKYEQEKRVTVISTERNLGFAKGNNVGYQYAKDRINADVVIVLNNDVIISQNSFVTELMKKIDTDSKVAIIAPDIVNKQGTHQNPVRLSKISTKELLWTYLYNLFLYIFMRVPQINVYIMRVIQKKHDRSVEDVNVEIKPDEIMQIVPHGAAIIYTPVFLKQEECAFNPQTFLYCEEDILYEYSLNKGYRICYMPSITLHHLEDVSTDSMVDDEINKRLFVSKHKLHSINTLVNQRLFYRKRSKSWRYNYEDTKIWKKKA